MSDDVWSIITLIAAILFFVALFAHYFRDAKKAQFDYPRLVARVAVFGALSTILYLVPVFNLSLPFLPSFLSLHFEEIPAFIGGFAYGPAVAVLVLIIKTAIKLPFTHTLGVGELTDLVLNLFFVLPSVIIYKKKRSLKGAFLGFAASFLLQNVAALFMNVYISIPFYVFMMGFSEESLLGMCQAVNSNVTDLAWSYGFWCVLPLNVIKDAAVLVVVYLLYKALHKPLRWERQSDKK